MNLRGMGPFANRTMYSLVGIANLSSRLTYVLQHDLGLQQEAATPEPNGTVSTSTSFTSSMSVAPWEHGLNGFGTTMGSA